MLSDGAAAEAGVHSRAAAFVLLVLLTIVWGVHWAVVKIGLESMPPLSYAALRIGSGAFTLLVLLAIQGRLRLPDRASLPIMASIGLGNVFASVLIMNLALQIVPAGRSSVLYYTMPLWVAVLLAARFRIPPTRQELVGLALGIAGLATLLNPGVIDWAAPAEVAGTLALLGNAVLWAGVTIHIRRHRWTRTPLELQPWLLLLALAPFLVLVPLFEAGRAIRWDATTVLVLLYSGPLATAFANWASQSITRSLGAQATGTSFLAIPVVGLASGALILGEPLGPVDLLGFGLILAGVAAATLMARQPEPAVAV